MNTCSGSPLNPFASWNRVFLRYCSGDTWTGQGAGPNRYGTLFAGHQLIDAVVEHLARGGLLANASDVVLSGASAGGIGTFSNCDWFAERLRAVAGPSVNVMCTPQSGLFFPADTHPVWATRLGIAETANVLGAEYVTELYGAFHDASCAAAMKAAGKSEALCWDGSTVAPHVESPILVAQNFWDQLQIDDILCWEDNAGLACPDAFLQSFRNATMAQLTALSKARPGFGTWMPSCWAHTTDMCMVPNGEDPTIALVNGVSYRDALAKWLEAGPMHPPQLVEQCSFPGPDSTTPCGAGCDMGCGGAVPDRR